MYAATTKDEEKAADGRFSTACQGCDRVQINESEGTTVGFNVITDVDPGNREPSTRASEGIYPDRGQGKTSGN